MSSTEEIALVKRIKSGDQDAKTKLVKANLRFVVSVAKIYQNSPVPLSDLINEGNIGLIKAAERFDETRGFKFISYAVWWIRQSILAALDEQSRLIKVPSNKLASMSKIRKAIEHWERKYERSPTTSELAEVLHTGESEVKESINSVSTECSLDAPIGIDQENSMLDFIPNQDSTDQKDTFYIEQLKHQVRQVLSRLKKRERKIIEMTFGINNPLSYTLDEISEQLGISRERVRQIKERALKKLSYHRVRKSIQSLTAA